MSFKWAYRYLRAQKRFILLFTLNLSLGLIGFLTLESFRFSLQEVLAQNSKNFLSADLSISARRALAPEEIDKARNILGPNRQESRLYEFFSMVSTDQGSRLVQIKAIEENYPFYGDMTLGSGKKIGSDSEKEIQREDKVWVYDELLSQLNLRVGDWIQLGEAKYRVSDTVTDDSTQTFRLSSIAPKIYVALSRIEKSGLIKKGTTFSDALLFKLPPEVDTIALKKKIFHEIPDPAVQVVGHKEAGEDAVRPLAYLSDYLGLVSLVALFLSLVGSAFMYRAFFAKQVKAIAIYNILGLQFSQIVKVLVIQVMSLGFLSFLFSLLGMFALFPALRKALAAVSSVQVPLTVSVEVLLIALTLSTLGALSISGFYLIALRDLRPRELFQEQFQSQMQWRKVALIYLIFPLSLFLALAIYQAHSWRVGFLFCGLFFASVLIVMGSNLTFLVGLGQSFRRLSWIFKHVGLQLQRKKRQNLSSTVALSLGALLMTLLPHLRSSIQKDLETPQGSMLPALFLFDIQDDQMEKIQIGLEKQGYRNLKFSPLVRARILEVNGKSFEKIFDESRTKTREDEMESRSRNRGFNLSYRDHLDPSESITEGKFWTEAYQASSGRKPEISVETKFADRLKFHLHDILKFDIQGVEIEGEITSLRSVQWNSFQPNFFVSFQPGVLDEAPKSWLVSLPKKADVDVHHVQDSIVKEFPNVSAVDVSRTIGKVLSIVERMSWSLQLMAFLCFVTGFFVLYSVVSQQVLESHWDLNLQKILGASFLQSGSQVWIQYGVLGLISSFVGCLVSLVVSAVLAWGIFEMQLVIDFNSVFWTVLSTTAVALIVSFFASWRLVRETPQVALQS